MRAVDVAKTIVHYGWCVSLALTRVPFVLYVGLMSSFPRPNLFKCATHCLPGCSARSRSALLSITYVLGGYRPGLAPTIDSSSSGDVSSVAYP